MADQWYLARNKQKHGPYSSAQLKEFAKTGRILPTDMLLKNGTAKWVQASQVKGLFPQPNPKAVPPSAASSVCNFFTSNWTTRKLGIVGGSAAGAILLLVVLMVAMSGGGRSRGGATKTTHPLTADFFPMTPGKERTYTFRIYRLAKDKKEYVANEDFANVDMWVKDDSVSTVYGSLPRWHRYYWHESEKDRGRGIGVPKKSEVEHICRIHDGSVERHYRDKWYPWLKADAKPGDNWTFSMPPAHKWTMHYSECVLQGGVPCVLIVTLHDEGDRIRRSKDWFMKGIGLVKSDRHSRPKVGEATTWLPYQQLIYSEWKGDSSRLSVESVSP